jgi:hypothetical protein
MKWDHKGLDAGFLMRRGSSFAGSWQLGKGLACVCVVWVSMSCVN